eukprot:jgi/Botrbrau1/2685/Bobra.0203s0028.1
MATQRNPFRPPWVCYSCSPAATADPGGAAAAAADPKGAAAAADKGSQLRQQQTQDETTNKARSQLSMHALCNAIHESYEKSHDSTNRVSQQDAEEIVSHLSRTVLQADVNEIFKSTPKLEERQEGRRHNIHNHRCSCSHVCTCTCASAREGNTYEEFALMGSATFIGVFLGQIVLQIIDLIFR